MKKLLLIGIISLVINNIKAQDTLPKFYLKDINNQKILVTWFNQYNYNCIQLAVQRSFDSTRFFSTIYSAQSPELPQNGVTDQRMPKGVKVFYRIFYVLEGGKYYFTPSIGTYSYEKIEKTIITDKRPDKNNNRETGNDTSTTTITTITSQSKAEEVKQIVSIYKRSADTLLFQIDFNDYKKFRDSVIRNTKDTLFTIDKNTVLIKPYIPKPIWKASPFIFTNELINYVQLRFPLYKTHKYRIVFYDEEQKEIFQIRQIKDAELTLDNTNFIHAGWFFFDLYEDEKLKEHNKCLVSAPF